MRTLALILQHARRHVTRDGQECTPSNSSLCLKGSLDF